MKNQESYSTQNIKHHRNIMSLMAIVPLAVMVIVGGVFYRQNAPSSPSVRVDAAANVPILSGTRDPYAWPFSRYSVWNMPIGSDARYVPANLPYANGLNGRSDSAVYSNGTVIPNGASIDIDKELIGVNPNDPVKTLSTPYGNASVRVPGSMSWNGAWNGCATFLGSDNKTLYSGQPLKLTPGGNPYWQYDTSNWPMNTPPVDGISIYGDGRVGCHGGSALSGYGGTVRKGELAGANKIRHALKVNIDCKRLCSNTTADRQPCTTAAVSARICGWRWPAFQADSGQPGHYGGSNPYIKAGTLFAIPPSANLSYIKSENARQLAEAMRDYGVYMVDDTALDRYGFSVENGAEWSDGQQFYKDLIEAIRLLQVVDNNGPSSVGGGGTPRQPLAPCFSTGVECNDSGTTPTTPPPPPPTPTPNPAPSGQSPYGGSAQSLPGKVEAENYDEGGEGVAYHDTSPTNVTGKYRNDGVDIENATGGGYNVGYNDPGEWREHTVNIPSGTYTIAARVSSAVDGGQLLVKLGSTTIATINVPNTGGWQSYQSPSVSNIEVSGGNGKVLRFETSGNSYTIDSVTFTKQGSSGGGTTPTPSPSPSPNPEPTPSPNPTTPPPPPISVPGAGTSDPVDIPDEIPVQEDGSLIADFNGDGLNDVVKDLNNDGKIDPNLEIVTDGTDAPSLTDTTQQPVSVSEYANQYTNTSNEKKVVRFKAGPLPEIRIAKPVAYTFLIAQGIVISGVSSYLAISKLAIFAGIRAKWGL